MPGEEDLAEFGERSFSLFGGEDKLIWKEDLNGKFSVTSAYNLQQTQGQGHHGKAQDNTNWKVLGKFKLPFKVKIPLEDL